MHNYVEIEFNYAKNDNGCILQSLIAYVTMNKNYKNEQKYKIINWRLFLCIK